MTVTGPAPDGASKARVIRLAAVDHAVSSRLGEPISKAQLLQLLDRANMPVVTGQGRPHSVYGTLAVRAEDFRLLEAVDASQLRALAGLA
jgi:hypothetical protein